MQKYHERCN